MALKSSVAEFKKATAGFKKQAVKSKDKEAPEFGFAGVDDGTYVACASGADMGTDDTTKQAYFKLTIQITEGKYKGKKADKTHFVGKPPEKVAVWENGKKTDKMKKLSESEREEKLQQSIDNVTFDLQKLGYDTAQFGDNPMGDEWPDAVSDINKNRPAVKVRIVGKTKSGEVRDFPAMYLIKADADSATGEGESSDDSTTGEATSDDTAVEEETAADEVVEETAEDEVVVEDEEPKPEPGSSKWMFIGNKTIKKQQTKIISVNPKDEKATVELMKDKKKVTVPWALLEFKE